jgi:hypothetical protein
MIKVFESRESNDPLPYKVGVLLGHRFSQGRFFISAQNKREAVETATGVIPSFTERSIGLARPNNPWLQALQIQGGLLSFPGMIVATHVEVTEDRFVAWSATPWAMAIGTVLQKGEARTWYVVGRARHTDNGIVYTPQEV